MFSSTGTFSTTQQDIADMELRALFSIQVIAYNLIDLKPVPVLLYSCELWGFHTAAAVEGVHLRLWKWVFLSV